MTDFNFDDPPPERFSPPRRQFQERTMPSAIRNTNQDTPLKANDSFQRRRDLTPTRQMAPLGDEDDLPRPIGGRFPQGRISGTGILSRPAARIDESKEEEEVLAPPQGAHILTAPRPPVGPQFHTLPLPRAREGRRKGFEVYVAGQIDYGELKDQNGMCVKYDFVKGPFWDRITGIEMGISQHSNKTSQQNSRIVWNYPFEVGYSSRSPQGWPLLVLQCFGRDGFGRSVMKAYGSVHVPLYPGTHSRFVHMFVPIEASLMGRLVGWLFGKPAEYHDPVKTVGLGHGRQVTRVQSGGVIKVTFMVSEVGMEKFGYDL